MPSDLFTDIYIPLCPSQRLAVAEDLSFSGQYIRLRSFQRGAEGFPYKRVSFVTICAETQLLHSFSFRVAIDLAEKTIKVRIRHSLWQA
jgi:hypothetical protein